MITVLKSLTRFNTAMEFSRSLKTVTVIGSGLMGSGIAQVSAQNGYNVHLVDMNWGLLEKASASVKTSLQRVANKKFADSVADQEQFVQKSLDLIKLSIDAQEAAKSSDLIIEAIVENPVVKKELFKTLDAAAPPSCIFSSNTSSLSIMELAAATNRRDRFGGLHFFNPPTMMRLVEVVSTADTSSSTTKSLTEFVESLGKQPAQCQDTPGFIVNRLLVPYIAEAVRLLERGVATAADIDRAMCLGAGHPMGPLTLADYVGLDTNKFILDGWYARFPDNPLFAPIPMLDRLVEQGHLGRKTGKGFYDYSAETAKATEKKKR